MTEKESLRFEKMRNALLTISKTMTTAQMRKMCSKPDCPLYYAEMLEMAYENIQIAAQIALRR